MARRWRNITYVADLDLEVLSNELAKEARDYGEVKDVYFNVSKKGIKFYITVYTYEEAPKDMELKPEITVWAWRRGR
jgi:hypothetical protein